MDITPINSLSKTNISLYFLKDQVLLQALTEIRAFYGRNQTSYERLLHPNVFGCDDLVGPQFPR